MTIQVLETRKENELKGDSTIKESIDNQIQDTCS